MMKQCGSLDLTQRNVMEGDCVVYFLGFLLLCAQRAVDAVNNPTVVTQNGAVRGITHEFGGRQNRKSVDVYYGIPYAQPPVGDLRFKLPVQTDRWDDVLDATKKPNTCMQGHDTVWGNFSGAMVWNPNTETSEDCLYLNIWVPKSGRSNSNNKAVFVWIYGGGFYSGSSTLEIYEAKYLAVENDVIVVSMQYRVGALGYLAMGHPQAPGNMGMFDQRMALEWVKRNIESFGGNSRNVTICGESAGAVSVGLHLLSPISRGLFDRAILQSGAPQTKWATIPMQEAERRARRLAELLGCDAEATKFEVIQCLRNKPAKEFQLHEFTVIGGGVVQFPFIPVIDGSFLVESPEESIRLRRFKKIPLLLGSNSNEGSFFLVYFDKDHFNISTEVNISNLQYTMIMDQMFKTYPRHPHRLNDFGMDAILFQYTNWLNPNNQTMIRHNIEQAVGDFHFVCSVNELAQAYTSAGQNVYYYRFTHRMSNHPWGDWMGVLHADEINFVFGEPLNRTKRYTAHEKELSKKMMRYWTNFAKTGDPNRGPDEVSLGIWPEYSEKQQYLELNLNLLKLDAALNVGTGPRTKQCAFWKHYLPRLVAGTADISSVEKDWKESYNEWKTRYIVDWKHQFDSFLKNYERRFQTCGMP
ncbi:acetylcholinesterase-like isoform X1 [Haliotis rufescens]|uniref:acetylcholinesterase-like isoform X1 n=2 Tax=Haliotis rufescens TaxID=6454 RepID=UPI001EAFD5E5|nr:acetylcholinesterase-like isoform X1 [Haliotis rufescens]